MTNEEIKEIIEKHQHWLKEDCEGWENMKANLREADLRGANLREADLREADLRGAYLRGAYLRGANLREADLREADLCGANLCGANLCGAYLCGANLCGANLCGANLRGADLCEANLCGANLRGAENISSVLSNASTSFFAIGCPENGAFTAFKKCGSYIVELEVCADAKRSSATSRKCRVSKAKVISITNLDGTPTDITVVASSYDHNFKYTVGEIVEEPKFDDNRWNECAPGIHCFITRNEAVNY